MSERTDQARRLELSEVQEVGDLVSGRARGLKVSLEGVAPFTACVIELGAAIPIARVRMVTGDLNHPDSVETGDVEFDERMQVTSLPSYAPTLQQLLEPPALRAALVKFFSSYPDAEITGTKLRVPAGAEGVTQRLIVDALEVAESIVRRFTEIGFLTTERPVTLPEGARETAAPWGQMALGAWSMGVLVVCGMLATGVDEPVFLGLGALMVVVGGFIGVIAGREK